MFSRAIGAIVGLVFAGILLIQTSVFASAVTMIVNEGFESGILDPWTIESGTPTVTSTLSHTGTYSVAAFAGDEIRQDFSAVATNNITEVSFWARRDQGERGINHAYTFYYDDGTEEAKFATQPYLGGDGWIFVDITSQLDPGKNLTGFSINGTSAGPAYMDDFVINATIPIPAALPLLASAFGLFGFLGWRRKRQNQLRQQSDPLAA